MIKLLEDLKEHNINQSVHYYGPGDLATGWEIKEVVENASYFDAFYENYHSGKIETIDEYIVYLFTLKFRALKEMIPLLLHEEHKEIIANLADKADADFIDTKKGNVIRFINGHIEEIFAIEDHVHDIRESTLKLIKQYSSGIKPEVYSYLCSKFYWLVIGDFDSFYRPIKADPTLFEKLYPSGKLSEIQERRFKETLDIFASILNGSNEDLKQLVNVRVSELCADVEALIPTIDTENVMLCEGTVREFTTFLQHTKHPKANDFAIHYKKVEAILDERIVTSGHHAKYEIPIGELVDHFTKTEHWVLRLLSLTHRHVPNSNPPKFQSGLIFEKDDTHHLIDFCSTNVLTDDYFTYSHQMMLDVHANVGAGAMVGIMSRPEVYQDFATLIMSAIVLVTEQMQRDDEHLAEDWMLLDQMLQTIIANRELGAESLRPLCYGAAMFTCSLMEKILRLYYIDRVRDRLYVPVDLATLGQLLTETNSEVVEIFDSIHIKHLAFFMLRSGEKKIGRNYRNRLAHWSEMKHTMLTVPLVAELLWLFVDVLNTIFWHYFEQLPQAEAATED